MQQLLLQQQRSLLFIHRMNARGRCPAMSGDTVVIVGAGPSGLATAACLGVLSVPCIILEKESCSASLWKLRAYDRLKLHLAKEFCALPNMPFPDDAPTFVPKDQFIQYLDHYVEHFGLRPVYFTQVESSAYDELSRTWCVTARNTSTGEVTVYKARFLVVATGENGKAFVPDVPGLETFPGEAIHSSAYKSSAAYVGKSALVVGSGNSGMEIAYDLSGHGARTAISIRSEIHVVNRELIYLGMVLVKYLPVDVVDGIIVTFANMLFGDLTKYGIIRPKLGPLALKAATGKSAVIDVGTVSKIKSEEIKVVKEPKSIRGNEVLFSDEKSYQYDSIIFATGYKSTANSWLKDEGWLLGGNGLPSQSFPDHWKGRNGLYCVGFARRGLAGVSMDAQNIAKHIKNAMQQ